MNAQQLRADADSERQRAFDLDNQARDLRRQHHREGANTAAQAARLTEEADRHWLRARELENQAWAAGRAEWEAAQR